MPPRFSIVYPTRHRPEFIREALAILELQGGASFEVVVCDNFIDPALSCERVCEQSGLDNVVYVHPPEPLGMVENWNHALPFATGDYVAYLTDKMFVLPRALRRVDDALRKANEPDIVSWTSDAFYPAHPPDYLGPGTYVRIEASGSSDGFRRYSPQHDLDRRGRAPVARGEQGASDYARGKLAFGAYRRELVERIVDRYGSLFHSINPDYTSMVLALVEARSAIEMPNSCVASVNTDIGNGYRSDTNDAAALAFLDSLRGGAETVVPSLFIPGLYASQHNGVAHDFLNLKLAYDLEFEFNRAHWIAYCVEDIQRPGRQWSSDAAAANQKRILAAFLASLEPTLRAEVEATLARRAASSRSGRPAIVDRLAYWVRRRRPRRRAALPSEIQAPSVRAAIQSDVAS
jgi:hypothetical protein